MEMYAYIPGGKGKYVLSTRVEGYSSPVECIVRFPTQTIVFLDIFRNEVAPTWTATEIERSLHVNFL